MKIIHPSKKHHGKTIFVREVIMMDSETGNTYGPLKQGVCIIKDQVFFLVKETEISRLNLGRPLVRNDFEVVYGTTNPEITDEEVRGILKDAFEDFLEDYMKEAPEVQDWEDYTGSCKGDKLSDIVQDFFLYAAHYIDPKESLDTDR